MPICVFEVYLRFKLSGVGCSYEATFVTGLMGKSQETGQAQSLVLNGKQLETLLKTCKNALV